MKILILLSLLVSSQAYAFNWQRCSFSQPVSGQGGGILEVMSTIVSNVGISSSQFLSSWGDCSMVGAVDKVKKTFIAQNLKYLKQDMAKGTGEYLFAYAHLHECNLAGKRSFGRSIKRQYFKVEEFEKSSDFEGIYEEMERPFTMMKDLCRS